MTFTVTYRDRTGAKREKRVEAASRSEAVAALKAQGIVPIRVDAISGAAAQRRRARNGESAATSKGTAYVLAAVFVILVGGGLWWWLAARLESVPCQVLPKHAEANTSFSRHSPKSVPKIEGMTYRTAVPTTITSKASPIPVAGTIVTNETANSERQRRGRMFKTEAETLLAMATPDEPGMSVPPLPDFSAESLSNSAEIALSSIIAPSSNDTERMLETKLTVAEQKEEFRALQKQENWSFAEYLTALHKKHTEDAVILREAHTLNESLYGDRDISDKEYAGYLKRINSELKERGIAPIDAPGDARLLEEEDNEEKTK